MRVQGFRRHRWPVDLAVRRRSARGIFTHARLMCGVTRKRDRGESGRHWGTPTMTETGVPLQEPRAGDPEVLGRHRVLGRLGAGGMGVVYLADGPFGRVAVKLVRE